MKPQRQPAQQHFAGVAHLIAKGSPPAWLVPGLEFFSGFVGADPSSSDDHKQGRKIFEHMHDAADLLIKRLPLFKHLPMGARSPDVELALDVLPRVRELLARAMKPSPRGGGPHPNVPRKTCAAVVVEAWRLVHGEPEPYSIELWKACNEYWQACGGQYRGGDVDNWKRDAEEAIAANHVWIRDILSALREQYATS